MRTTPRAVVPFLMACATAGVMAFAGTATGAGTGGPAIEVNPNPAHPGEKVTITGHCDSAGPVRAIFTPNGKPFDGPVRVTDRNPRGFRAEAQIDERIGAGAIPVYVDCGSDYGETKLVTQP